MTIISKNRWLVKRSTIPGVQPIPPTSAQTSTIIPDNTWSHNMVMNGELYMNTADQKLWMKCSGDTPILIGSVSGVTEFVDLSDTPSDLAPGAGMLLMVNSGGTALEFADVSVIVEGLTANTFTNLTDAPDSYVGQAGKYVIVNSGETGLEFSTNIGGSITGSTDFEGGDYTLGNIIVGTGTGFSATTPSDNFVMTTGIQVIDGAKTFNDIPVFDAGVSIFGGIDFEGNVNTVTINNINTSFTANSHTTLATSKATKDYIDLYVQSVAVVTADVDQTIEGNKTFEGDHTAFNNPIFLSDYFYFGDSITDGSWRIYISVNGLVFERRESGVWNYKGGFSA